MAEQDTDPGLTCHYSHVYYTELLSVRATVFPICCVGRAEAPQTS